MAQEFMTPDFMLGTSAEEIQQRMMNNLPEDIDGMLGGFAYDLPSRPLLKNRKLSISTLSGFSC